jgi:DNA-binding response OmpR family regulator
LRLLLIDDEQKLLRALQQLLIEQQYAVDIATDGESGLEMALTGLYEVLVIDVMMPKMSGIDVVRTLRESEDSTPILLLTARDAIDDRVRGLDAGADDYLTKPFANQEFLARIRALTRRSGDVMPTQVLTVGRFSLDLQSRVIKVDDQSLFLTAKEFQMLELFLRNAGQVLPKELIFDRVWGFDGPSDTNAVEIYVHFLRKKIDAIHDSMGTVAIETVRGVGYLFKGM